MSQWPTAQLDRVRQLRVLAEVLPGVGLVERVLDAPYGRVWSFLTDFEHSVPAFDRWCVRCVFARARAAAWWW
jgi:hypothetical protein